MENTLLIGLSRQIALRRQMDTIAQNIANMSTSGFKTDSVLFEEYLMPVARMTEQRGQDRILSYVDTAGFFRDFSEGSFQRTGNELDVAISGDGWLVVETPNGERFTRNGQLSLDQEGMVVTNEGYPVLGTGGTITISSEESQIVIAKDGSISTTQGNKGSLRVVTFNDNGLLEKQGSSLYSSNEAPQEAENPKVIQGMFELSNVKPILEMTRMMDTVRAYTSTAKAMESADKMRRKAIEKLGGSRNS